MTSDPRSPPGRSTGSPSKRRGRRSVLAALTGLSVALAGCTTGDEVGDDGTTEGEPDGEATEEGPGTTTAGETGEGETTDDGTTGDGETTDEEGTTDDGETTTTGSDPTDDLDLREANVTGVEYDERGDDYRFSVELYHDDDGEDGYANWWQVETLDGDRLGRRELLHAHSTQPFTRSETIALPDDVGEVVVRGHDQTHGYGGQAAILEVDTGTVEFVDQGAEPNDFSDRG